MAVVNQCQVESAANIHRLCTAAYIQQTSLLIYNVLYTMPKQPSNDKSRSTLSVTESVNIPSCSSVGLNSALHIAVTI